MPVGRRNVVHCAAAEERRQPAGRVEELDGIVGGRRVEHQQVVVAGDELVELLDRGELLRARDGVRELAVDPVALDLLGTRGCRCDAVDQLVECALGVEHHRPQLTLHLEAVQALG